MHRKEANLRSPLRILDRWIRTAPGAGGPLRVIVAPRGVGKSACLVQLGLDALMRDRPVLHVAMGQSVEHVAAWYDALFDELAEEVDLADRGGVRESIARARLIWSVPAGFIGARGVEEALAAFRAHLARAPALVLVDGFGWEGPGCTAALGAVKASVEAVGGELWMTVGEAPGGTGRVAPLCDGCAALVDVGVHLEPDGRRIGVTLLDDLRRVAGAEQLPLVLQGGALRAAREDEDAASDVVPEAFTLLATGSAGAEEEFGACAERWGVQEVNFTCGGREPVGRGRGVVELGDDELRVGEVSAAYVRAHLHRTFPEGDAIGRVLPLIWHQVSAAGEVFAVGTLYPDKTVHGGTGWAVELARHWGKPVHLFDQDERRWLRWSGADWAAEEPPAITSRKFAGAGTRSLSDEGRAAIRGLFERTFGAAPR